MVINVNGCFWHGHAGCKRSSLPKQNYQYWQDKIERNTTRDRLNNQTLREMGWKVIIVYECELKAAIIQKTIDKIISEISVG